MSPVLQHPPSMPPLKYTDLILDVNGVLLNFSMTTKALLPPRTIKLMLDSNPWHEFEKGKISQQQCYDAVSRQFDLGPGVCERVIDQLGSTLVPNTEFIDAIRHIKTIYPGLRVHAFSNMSCADFTWVRKLMEPWGILDNIFPSASLGYRKPEIESYKAVLKAIKAKARTCIFVDDRIDNVTMGHALGLQGIFFDVTERVVTRLHNLLGDPVKRGMEFLRKSSKMWYCETDTGLTLRDNFSQLIILECTGDPDLVAFENEGWTWQYFIGDRAGTEVDFPKDLDTTSLALTTLDAPVDQKEAVMDMMLQHLNSDELPLTYFDQSRRRFCPYVAANVLRLFYLNGQGHKLSFTLQYLCRYLDTQAYEIGARYYEHPDWILYILADLCGKCSDSSLKQLRRIVKDQVRRRIGINRDAFAAALRVLAAQSLYVRYGEDLRTLKDSQRLDGGWDFGWICRYGTTDARVGNRGVTTALAIKAIKVAIEREDFVLWG